MLQLKAIYTGGICIFYVEVVKVIIDLVHNTYPEWVGITVKAQIYSFHIKMIHD